MVYLLDSILEHLSHLHQHHEHSEHTDEDAAIPEEISINPQGKLVLSNTMLRDRMENFLCAGLAAVSGAGAGVAMVGWPEDKKKVNESVVVIEKQAHISGTGESPVELVTGA